MMILGGSDDASPESRAYILDQLAFLGRDLEKRVDEDPAHRRALPAIRARHHPVSRESEGERAAIGVSGVGRPSAIAIPAASGTAAGRSIGLSRTRKRLHGLRRTLRSSAALRCVFLHSDFAKRTYDV